VVQIAAGETSVIDTDAEEVPPRLTVTRSMTRLFQSNVVNPYNDGVTSQQSVASSGDLGNGRFRSTPNSDAAQGFADHFTITPDDWHGGATKTVAATVSSRPVKLPPANSRGSAEQSLGFHPISF
jgi:hypothetical protein